MNQFDIEISNRQKKWSVDTRQINDAVRSVLSSEGIVIAEISVAIVDDEEMHELNRKYLNHDYPTDVLSFVLENPDEQGRGLIGEIIVSTDTANRECVGHGLSGAEELLLYVIHGTLHLVGYDDKDDQKRVTMRSKEAHFLAQFGIKQKRDPSSIE